MCMSKAEPGAVGEFIGPIAILITLVGIYYQVRQQDRPHQAESNDSAFKGFETIRSALINNAEVAYILAGLGDDPETMNSRD